MPTLVFVGPDGTEQAIDATLGDSVMANAARNGVPGIVAECGGNCSCGTCHVWVREEFRPLVGEPGLDEEDLLDIVTSDRRPGSRLSCQLTVTEALDGCTVDVPAEQP